MSMGQSMELSQRMTPEQRAELRLVQELRMNLVEPDVPNATRGMEGLRIANQILIERNSIGILIGGIARSVWKQNRKPEELAAHKDVDVLVLNPEFKLSENFEGGIDWWLPENGRITVKDDVTWMEVGMDWWVNANDVVLNYKVHPAERLQRELSPGLHLPVIEDVVEMEARVAEGMIDERVNISNVDELLEYYKESIRKKMGTSLIRNVREETGLKVLDKKYGTSTVLISMETIPLKHRAAIKGFRRGPTELP